MNSPQRTPHEPAAPLPRNASRDSVVLDYGLLAQWRLSPYALGFFGIGLPLFIWAASLAVSVWLLASYLLLFMINWTVFMIMKNQSGKRMTTVQVPDPAIRYILIRERRLRQGAAGALWTLTLLMISLSVSLSGQGLHNEFMLMICGGAILDFAAQRFNRAPAAIRKIGMEWAYRLLQEPRRLWWRYLKTNTSFVQLTAREMLHPARAFRFVANRNVAPVRSRIPDAQLRSIADE